MYYGKEKTMNGNRKIRIAFVGTGSISGIYLENLTKVFREVEIAGICDLIRERAERRSKEFGPFKIYNDMYEIFADPTVDVVLNITRPDEHYEVSKAALLAGKHVYSEKPLASTLEKGRELVEIALEKGLYLGGAPDTFMGAAIQTAREMIEEGAIGTLVGGCGHMKCRGHESWHHDPEFYYKRGGGPLLDMGPYYVTAFITLLGSVKSVQAINRTTYPTRTITSKEKYGEIIDVDVPTHVNALMEFENGAVAHLLTTFDTYSTDFCNRIEIYGSEGTMIVPDPNNFCNPIKIWKNGEFTEHPVRFGYNFDARALGLCDMCNAIRDGREPRASYKMTYHALEVMMGIVRAGDERRIIDIESRHDNPPLMKKGLEDGILD